MIRSSTCLLRQADPFPALSGKLDDRPSYTTPWDIIRGVSEGSSVCKSLRAALRQKYRRSANISCQSQSADSQIIGMHSAKVLANHRRTNIRWSALAENKADQTFLSD
jgi:hypothetical protein